MTASLGSLRRPAVAGLLIGILLVGVWFELLWTPQSAALTSAHQRDQQATSDLFSAEQNLGHLKHLAKISDQLNALDGKLTAAIPATDALDTFLLQLNAMAAETGVKLSTVSAGQPTVPKSGLTSIRVSLAGTGTYFEMQDFLDALRTGPRLMVIDSLQENPSGSTVTAAITGHLMTGLLVTAPIPKPIRTPTTAAPTGIISGPVSRAKAAVNAANANTAALETGTR